MLGQELPTEEKPGPLGPPPTLSSIWPLYVLMGLGILTYFLPGKGKKNPRRRRRRRRYR